MLEQHDKVERKLKKVKIGLMRNPKFALWSGIMMVGKTQLVDNIPTACTNGRDEMYGREFIKDLPEKQLAFVILHENLHKAFRHLTTWRKLYEANPMLANIACDHVINLMLVEMDPTEQHIEFIKNPDGSRMGCFDMRFKGMSAKQVYDILKEEQDKNGGGGTVYVSFDEHDWEGAGELPEEERKQLEREIDQAIRQGQIAAQKAGAGGGDIDRAIGELLEPKIDWRETLREFVSSICSARDTSSWRRVNRRFLGSDIYMPTMVGEKVGHIVVGVDTSGSIGGDEINRFLSEVSAIAETVQPEVVDLIYWDGQVAAHETYTGGEVANIVSSTKPRGGGGTDPTCMMKYLKQKQIKPECIIQLTDGEIYNWGDEWEAPIMWTIANRWRSGRITAPVGKTIHIQD